MIKLQVIGNLGRDAIVNVVGNTNVINFSVAHSETFKKDGEKVEKVTWVECAKWGENTNVAPYLKKGTQVYVEGTPEIRTYEKKDGSQGYSMSIRVLALSLLGGGNKDDSNGSNGSMDKAPTTNAGGAPDDDLPF